MRNLILSIVLMLLALGKIDAQKDPIKWGKISKDDLSMSSYEQDPEAGAVILCDLGKIKFNFSLGGSEYRFSRHKRVKILKRSGFDQADVVIPYHEAQAFSNFKAQIFAPDGSKVELNKHDVFDESVVGYWHQKRFTFPNVQEGSVLEYSYSITSSNLFTLRGWYFQHDVPAQWSELRFEMLEYFNYSTVLKGSVPMKVNESGSGGMTTGGVFIPTATKRWAAEHVPALKKENFVACMDDHRSKMQFQLNSINIPGEFPENYEWEEIVSYLVDADDFGLQYRKKAFNQRVIFGAAEAIDENGEAREKAKAIYDYVNEKVEWNGEYWCFAQRDLDDALEKGKGNSGELNLMVLALLRKHGITSYPVIISSRSNGKLNPYYPLLSQFDHVVVLAEIDEKNYWIDAGDPLRPFGMLAEESLNWQGLLINDLEETYKWVDINTPMASSIVFSTLTVDETGEMSADISCSYKGYHAHGERQACKNSDGKMHWQSRLEERFAEAQVNEINMENLSGPDEKLKGKLKVVLPEGALVNGDIIYLSPILYSRFSNNPFKQESRILPIEYAYPFQEKIITNLSVPNGYLVEGIPESIKLTLFEEGGSFSYRVSENPTGLQVTCELKLNKSFFLPEDYEGLQQFFSMVEEKLEEQVVLKKKT